MKFIPVFIDPDGDSDNHLADHAEAIARGEPCECATVDVTETGLIVVSEADPMSEMTLDPEEDGYDLGGPYL